MPKFLLEYQAGEIYHCSYSEYIPIIGESIEQIYVWVHEQIEKAKKEKTVVKLGEHEIDVEDLIYVSENKNDKKWEGDDQFILTPYEDCFTN